MFRLPLDGKARSCNCSLTCIVQEMVWPSHIQGVTVLVELDVEHAKLTSELSAEVRGRLLGSSTAGSHEP